MKALLLITTTLAILTAAPTAQAANEDAENAFSAMLKNATLNGTWAPIDKSLLGDDQKDGYEIVSATKKEGDVWVLVSKMKFQGQEMQIPIPVRVKFAGDTAVMILNNLPLGDGTTWSARILFHDDVYAGSWWGPDKAKKSGIVSGTITRSSATE